MTQAPGWYRGDVATIALGPCAARCVVRLVDGDRAQVQIGTDWTWVFTGELQRTGEVLTWLPRSEWGWRRLGRIVAAIAPRDPS